MAIKIVDKGSLSKEEESSIESEVRLLKLVKHSNIIKLYQVLETDDKLFLVLEYGEGGDMLDHLDTCGPCSRRFDSGSARSHSLRTRPPDCPRSPAPPRTGRPHVRIKGTADIRAGGHRGGTLPQNERGTPRYQGGEHHFYRPER